MTGEKITIEFSLGHTELEEALRKIPLGDLQFALLGLSKHYMADGPDGSPLKQFGEDLRDALRKLPWETF